MSIWHLIGWYDTDEVIDAFVNGYHDSKCYSAMGIASLDAFARQRNFCDKKLQDAFKRGWRFYLNTKDSRAECEELKKEMSLNG